MINSEVFIIKRDGKKETFSLDKIKNAIAKAFLSVGSFATQDVITTVLSRVSVSDGMNVEEIQNQVEVALMAEHYYSVAKAYMLYRQKHLEDREVRDKLKFLLDYCDASNPATGSKYDANANVENKNIATLIGELPKSNFIRLNRRLLTDRLKDMYGKEFVTSILLIIYGLYFILYPYFSYQAIIPFFQQYNQMLYGFLNREYDTVLQTQDEVFFQNNQKEMKGLMKKYYGSRYRFLMVYEVVSIVRRKKQIMYQYFAIVLITMLLSQIDGKYIEYVLLFSILILGQNVVSYNVQNELRLVKKGFPLRYSLKEKLQCKSVIGMFLLLLPMLCYWIAYKIELFSIILWIWIPIQSIIIYTAKNRLQRLLYLLPFYILSLLSMRVWQMFF